MTSWRFSPVAGAYRDLWILHFVWPNTPFCFEEIKELFTLNLLHDTVAAGYATFQLLHSLLSSHNIFDFVTEKT